jgi:DNA-directed RNA polymerase subunit RPC12/RpoP
MSIHELNLLENALDSLTESLSKFEEGRNDPKAYKFSVLHMAHFIELIFKYHIATKHHLLIYKNPFSTKINPEKTIGLWECINFINNEDPEALDPGLKHDLEWFKKLRNDIEHHKFTMDVPEVRITMGRLFRSVMDFIDNYTNLDVESNIPTHAISTFQVLSDEYELLVHDAIAKAEEIERETPSDYQDPEADPIVLECGECGHNTLAMDDDSETGYKCTFCNNTESDEIPAACSSCGAKTIAGELYSWQDEQGNPERRCYYCSGRYQMDKH